MIKDNYLENKVILYVEDDELIQQTTTQTLCLFNIKVIRANNGVEGVELFKQNQNEIDLVITDIKMPKMDGLEMTRIIKSINIDLPVIITTAHHEIDLLISSIELGVSSYVLKPMDIYKLKDSIIKALEVSILKKDLINKNKELKKEISKNEQKHKIMIKQSRFALMGELINMIAHQWRQPLASIGTAAYNLKYKLQLDKFDFTTKKGQDECKDFIDHKLNEIEMYVQNLTSTIDDFRSFYSTNKNKENKPISISVQNAINIIGTSLYDEDIKLSTDLNNKSPISYVVNEITHVILNILTNARDNFLQKNITNKAISIKITEEENSIIISITDNGGGISEDIIDKIFDPYFTTKTQFNGTGLGLYMSKLIVENHHNGKLNVKNTSDGVCFSIILSKDKQP